MQEEEEIEQHKFRDVAYDVPALIAMCSLTFLLPHTLIMFPLD
jgi:hypothetical protein